MVSSLGDESFVLLEIGIILNCFYSIKTLLAPISEKSN